MNYTNPTIPQMLLIALVGFAVVFVVLIILMGIIWMMGQMLGAKASAPTPTSASAPAPAATPAGLVLENVSENEAAMVMAIIADELKKDPAQLNFISIREVK